MERTTSNPNAVRVVRARRVARSNVEAFSSRKKENPSTGSGRTALFVAGLLLAAAAATPRFRPDRRAEARRPRPAHHAPRRPVLRSRSCSDSTAISSTRRSGRSSLSCSRDDATLEIGGKGVPRQEARARIYADRLRAGRRARGLPCQSHAVPDRPGRLARRQDRLDSLARLGDEHGRLGPAALRGRVRQGERHLEVQARVRALHHVSSWAGWGKDALNNTWPDKFNPAPDLPPSTIYLTYPAYYIIPYHYPNPVTGKAFKPDTDEVGAYAGPPGSAVQKQWRETVVLRTGRSPSTRAEGLIA